MPRARAMLLALVGLAACGSRTGLDVGLTLEDASASPPHGDDSGIGIPSDASLDDDATLFDAGRDAPCSPTPPVVDVYYCHAGDPDPSCCNFAVEWTCGHQAFHVGGGCSPSGASAQAHDMSCWVDGVETNVTTGGNCNCTDQESLIQLADRVCDSTGQ